jgi:hypothetical protein
MGRKLILLGLGAIAAAAFMSRRKARLKPAEPSGLEANGSRVDRYEGLRKFVEAGERHRDEGAAPE